MLGYFSWFIALYRHHIRFFPISEQYVDLIFDSLVLTLILEIVVGEQRIYLPAGWQIMISQAPSVKVTSGYFPMPASLEVRLSLRASLMHRANCWCSQPSKSLCPDA